MSFAASSFQAFRTCRASLSSRTLAHSALGRRQTRLSRLGTRCYSEEKTTEKPTPAREELGREDTPTEVDPCAEVKNKLKAKEGEATDLIVSIYILAELGRVTEHVLPQGRLRYLQADFLNLQRNSAREKEQTKDFAISRFASDLLETVDVLSMALKVVPPEALKPTSTASSESSESSQSSVPLPKRYEEYLQELHTGVEMTQRQLLQTLFKYKVKPFDPTGDKFDPNLHEALYQAPVPGMEPDLVIECQKPGYMIKDRVLRAAQVGVSQETS